MNSPASERRSFSIHPAIIKTLINEQAGSLPKAMTELVMNAVDAGATKIELDIDASGAFAFKDNGKGFSSREEIEQFFETFGTPHEADDAYYGRFRIGRGQIMSYARTVWRSGHFEMRVDLDGSGEFFGYDLIEHAESVPGCRISGTIYKFSDYSLKHDFTGWGDEIGHGEFCRMIQYVSVPVLVNSRQVNTLPEKEQWQAEDEHAWYKFDRQDQELRLFNRGIFVCAIDARNLGIGGTVSTKTPLMVNLARNSVIEHKCLTWRAIELAIRERFSLQLGRVKKLTNSETVALLRDLLFTDLMLDYSMQHKIQALRFIPDVFDNLKSPQDMIVSERFTLFDGKHMAIAERVQREGLATVIMPKFMRQARVEITVDNANKVILRLRERLGWSTTYPCTFIPFEKLVKELSDTSDLLTDDDLGTEEKLVLNALREINNDVAWITNGKHWAPRQLIAGTSDRMLGWTDGSSYIAIHRNQLKGIRGKGYGAGPARLVALLVHEYAHLGNTAGEHHHDYDFLSRFHEAILHRDFGSLVDKLFRRYVAGICKYKIVPSSEHGAHLRGLFKYADKLHSRTRSAQTEPSAGMAQM